MAYFLNHPLANSFNNFLLFWEKKTKMGLSSTGNGNRLSQVESLCNCGSFRCKAPALFVYRGLAALIAMFSSRDYQTDTMRATVIMRRAVLSLGDESNKSDRLLNNKFFSALKACWRCEGISIELRERNEPNGAVLIASKDQFRLEVSLWIAEDEGKFPTPMQLPTNLSDLSLCPDSGLVSCPRNGIHCEPQSIMCRLPTKELQQLGLTVKSLFSLVDHSILTSLHINPAFAKSLVESSKSLFVKLLGPDNAKVNPFSAELIKRLNDSEDPDKLVRVIAPFCPFSKLLTPMSTDKTMELVERGLKWITPRCDILGELRIHYYVFLLILARVGLSVLDLDKDDLLSGMIAVYLPSDNFDDFKEGLDNSREKPSPIGQFINDLFDGEIFPPCDLVSTQVEINVGEIGKKPEDLDLTFGNSTEDQNKYEINSMLRLFSQDNSSVQFSILINTNPQSINSSRTVINRSASYYPLLDSLSR